MLSKWKHILTNWVNCYFDNKKEECITVDTLLTVITHLHINLKSLDESSSSILEAQNVEEFLLEKYPEFKFENGTVEPTNEEEVYLVASLLLFFVCVNSKEVDIKQAMCSKLSSNDQETILKFSKSLMECSPVTYKDVKAAITDACGEEAAREERGGARGVAETPPALRSLHGAARRLQAALDAERFDRAFLQDELARHHDKVDRLLKEKEQYKLEILSLKSKISLCCGQDSESRGPEAVAEETAKLTRQLDDLEERLVATQEKLDDAQYERDSYKAKIEDLKKDRDKWVELTQQETSRATQLAEELETERRRVQALQELVAELRQHHQNNGLDGSQLECDDPNASVHSINNASVCSEVCANVIEVQLTEERAKVVQLQQQIQNMQDQLNDLAHRAENEKLSLEGVIAEKDNDIFNLKHRINEEIEEKNNLKEHYNDVISKLHNDINELEQNLKENSESSRTTIEQKMQEIQTLQEEKLSLLQSLSDETTKLETIIKNLKTDIDTEKNLKVKMKEDFENQLMKLNEKVLNRNNELVELQNKVFEKGEQMEQLNIDLKNEKQRNLDMSNKYNDDVARLNGERNQLEHTLHQKIEEAKGLQKRLAQNVSVFDELNKEIDELRAANDEIVKNNIALGEEREGLLIEIQRRDFDHEGMRKEIENITNIFCEEKNKFVRTVEERNATINTLQVRLRDEIQYKTGLEAELQNLHQAKSLLSEELLTLNKELSTLKSEIQEKDRTVYALDLYLKEEKHTNKNLKIENDKLNEDLLKLTEEVTGKSSEIAILEAKLDSTKSHADEELTKKDVALEELNQKLETEIREKELLQATLETLNEQKMVQNNDLIERNNELTKLKQEYENLCQVTEDNIKVIESLGNKIEMETKKYLQLELEFDAQTTNLMAKLSETEKTVKEISSKSRITIESKELQIQTLKLEVDNLNRNIETERENNSTVIREKEALTQKLEDEISYKNKIEKEYQNQCAIINNLTSQFTSEIAGKSKEINDLKGEIETLMKTAEEKSKELKIWESKVVQEQDATREMVYQKSREIKQLQAKIEDLNANNEELEQELKKEIASKKQAIDALQAENEQLHFTIEEDNSNHEVIIKEKDNMIENLEGHLKVISVSLESLRQDHETATLIWEKQKIELRGEIDAKDKQLEQMQELIKDLKSDLEQSKLALIKTEEDSKKRIEEIVNNNNESDSKTKDQITQLQTLIVDLERSNESLKTELCNEKVAKDVALKRKCEIAEEKCQLENENHLLIAEKDQLLTEKSQLLEEKELLLKDKDQLLTEKELILSEKVLVEQCKGQLETEKAKLNGEISQLIKEKEQLEAEKKQLTEVKEQLLSENVELNEKRNLIATDKNQIECEKSKITVEKDQLEHEKNQIIAEKEKLELEKGRLLDQNDQILTENELLLKDKNLLIEEKEQLLTVKYQLEKSKAELETEKIQLESQKTQLESDKGQLLAEKELLIRDKDQVFEENKQLLSEKAYLEECKSHLETENSQLINERDLILSERDQIVAEKSKLIEERDQLKEVVEKQSIQLLEDKNQIETQVDQFLREIVELKEDKNQLANENEQLKKQNVQLSKQNENLLVELNREKSATEKLLTENTSLLEEKKLLQDEKTMLTQEIQEERSLKELIEQERHSLLKQKEVIHQQLADEISAKNEAETDFAQQLQEARSSNELLKQEKLVFEEIKDSLERKLSEEMRIKVKLEGENDHLQKEIDAKNALNNEVNTLKTILAEERSLKEHLVIEKTNLCDENNTLKHDILELKTIQDVLRHDREVLEVEKERLEQSLSEEKAARDELESEKNVAVTSLQELSDKYALEIKEKDEHISSVATELKQMKTDFKKHEDISVHLTSVLNSGLEKLLRNINKEEIGNEVLQKLVSGEKGDDLSLGEQCDLLVNIADTLSTELSLRRHLEKALEHESTAVNDLKEMVKEKEMQVLELQTEVKRLQQVVYENQVELSKQSESYNTSMDSKVKDIQNLKLENKTLNNELNDVKVQLEVKVHSLKEKLIDNENLTDKLKKTYECQIENLNVMITKLTSYLKEKTAELEALRKDKDRLQQVVDENQKVIKTLEDEVKNEKVNQEKLITDFESERQVLKNMVTVTESIMEDQKVSLNKAIADQEKVIEALQEEKKGLELAVQSSKDKMKELLKEKQTAFDVVFKELTDLKKDKELVEKDLESTKELLKKEVAKLKEELASKVSSAEILQLQNKVLKEEKEQLERDVEYEKEKIQREMERFKDEIKEKVLEVESLESRNEELTVVVNRLKDDLLCLQEKEDEIKMKKDSLETDLLNRIEKLTKVLNDDTSKNDKFKFNLQEKLQSKAGILEKVRILTDEIIDLVKEKNEYISKLDEVKADCESNEIKAKEEIERLKVENGHLVSAIEENKTVIANLEQLIKQELDKNQQLCHESANDRLSVEGRFRLLQEYQSKAEKMLQERDKEIASLRHQIKTEARLNEEIEELKEQVARKDMAVAKIAGVKDEVIITLNKELYDEKIIKERYEKELETKTAAVYELRQKVEDLKKIADEQGQKKDLIREICQKEAFATASQDRITSQKHSAHSERDLRDRHQVSTPTSDLTQSSIESLKTITDLEKIIHDKNRTITTLQSDITYLKSLMADSENKLLDVTKELELTKENGDQLSAQLKKTVQQKNEEISDLKKQVNKMSATENRATQIIKVSAKYQAIILKRIAEIKSNTILKELTNFGNTTNSDSELKRNLNAGAITMEDLENFLETTDRHLKRCTEKQIALQKERDRLAEVNKINESEIINMKKFLTELSLSFKTFNSIKDLYTQKLSRVVSVQRTVRREILNLEGRVTDSMMCKLERGYAAVMQDLSECAMNLERWVERSIARTISTEKIKQAFTSDTERQSLATTSYQNASLEVQLEELENSFQKLLEEVVRAQKGEVAKDPQAVTVMEVRAEYEDKLNRMKAKMKQLYQEQIQVFKDKQKEEIATLHRELHKTREKLAESSRAYEEHIKSLTNELWNVGEKFLMKKDEADWLRKKQRSGSLMSLQHVHSSGLVRHQEEAPMRCSDAASLRSLPTRAENHRDKRDGRGLQMSDEEGEVFDNRWLKELSTPRRETIAVGNRDGARLSELKWRNSLCPPHLKSCYPAETQFANTLDEEDIKSAAAGGRLQRKEVGITAYKKPGPPTPSKQAGRLSATDSELRESLRVEAEPSSSRKAATPSILRSFFRTSRTEHAEGTPRKRLSNIFRKK